MILMVIYSIIMDVYCMIVVVVRNSHFGKAVTKKSFYELR